MRGFDTTFGVRHHANHIAACVEHASNLPRRTVDAFGIAERDPAIAFEPVERVACRRGRLGGGLGRDGDPPSLALHVPIPEGYPAQMDP